jgi:photosystem II stability/assembly factor-like uncharacterized protein
MYRIFLKVVLAVVMSGGMEASFSQDATLNVKYFNTLSHLSIRALEARSDSCAWFSADHGVWGYTEDAGKTWHIDSIKVDSVYPEFRSIAMLNDSTVLLLGIASPAYLFKTTNKGKAWRLVYKNTDKNIFFDSMKFTDEKVGMAVADPIDEHFLLLMTFDEGSKWHVLDSSRTASEAGESLFASSNTNVDYTSKRAWFATGGTHARVVILSEGRKNEKLFAYDTPIIQGGKMTGIFSMDFFDDTLGVIAGGNYEKTDTSIVSLAVTYNGGKNWKTMKGKKPFFGSCVQFKSADTFFVTGHDGTFICDHRTGKISELKDASGSSLKFHTLRFSPSGKSVWFAGDKGRIAFINFAK